MAEYLGNFLKGIGEQALKQWQRASSSGDPLATGSQLFVVQPEHWLIQSLCEYKRRRHASRAVQLVRQSGNLASLEDVKNKRLSELLTKGSQAGTTVIDSYIASVSGSVLAIACVFSSQLPEFEPLLVEVAVAHCIREWCQNKERSATDLKGFDDFLLSELQSDHAREWFNCQFFIDMDGLLALAPVFYKDKITNQQLQDLVALCVAESAQDLWACAKLLSQRLHEETNKSALSAWTAWVQQELVVAAGLPPTGAAGDSTGSDLGVMCRYLVNASQLVAHKKGYFAIGVDNANFTAEQRYDLSGVIVDRPPVNGVGVTKFAGFLYDGCVGVDQNEV